MLHSAHLGFNIMRIAFVAPFSGSGIGIFIDQYYRALSRMADLCGHLSQEIDTNEFIASQKNNHFTRNFYRLFSPLIDKVNLLDRIESYLGRNLINDIHSFGPDCVFLHVINSGAILPVVKHIRSVGIPVVMWIGPHPDSLSKNVHDLLTHLDCVFCYDPLYIPIYKSIGCKRIEIIPLGVDLPFFDDVVFDQNSRKIYDISFIGVIDEKRRRVLNLLKDFNLNVWSWNIKENDSDLGGFYRGQAAGHEVVHIMKSSKICLNLHREDELSGGNYRLFEIPACRSMQIVDNLPNVANYFHIDKEVVVFDDETELPSLVKYYLGNDTLRNRISMAGYSRVASDHKLQDRFSRMMSVVNQL